MVIPKVLAVFAHRPEKVAAILPFSGLDYRVITPDIVKKWVDNRIVANTTKHIPENVIYMLHIPYHYKMLRLARREKVNIFVSHGGIVGFWAWILARLCGAKFVMRLGGHVYDEYDEHTTSTRLWERFAYWVHFHLFFWNLHRADQIIVVTQEMKDKLCQRSGKNPEQVSVVPVPIDKQHYYIPHDTTFGRVLVVANVCFKSKMDALLKYLPSLHHYDLKVIAPGRYGPELASKLNIPIKGFIEQIEQEYRRASVFCYFSYLDGCPNVILEAWANKLPVVVNRCGWSEELIQDGVTGFLVDTPEDAERCVKMLLESPEIAKGVGQNAYRYLMSHHTEEIAGKRLGEVLRGVV